MKFDCKDSESEKIANYEAQQMTFDMRYFFISVGLLFLLGCNADEGWIDLFNGENLDGWHVYGGSKDYNGWDVQGGVLVFDPAKRTTPQNSSLMTDKQYTNFELSMDWMIGKNGNSGLFWSVVEDEKYEQPWLTGPEIQIVDDGWTEYIEERGDINRAGSLYGMLPPTEIVSKPSGEWNSYVLRIDHKANQGYLIFNDVKVVEFPIHGSAWDEMVSESSFADWEAFGISQTGHICLQDYGGKVAFRNIKIRELPQ